MVAALLSLLLALGSTVLAVLSVAAWVRGRRVAMGRDAGRSALVVVPVPRGEDPGRALARSLAAAAHGGSLSLRVACAPGNPAGERWAEEARRAAPGLDIQVVESPIPGRHVPAAWLASEAARGVPAEVVALVDPRASPASRDVASVLACAGHGGATWMAALPVPGTGAGVVGALQASVASDLAPLVASACGAAGLPTVLAVGTREAWDAADGDPLVLNRPSRAIAAALQAGVSACLVPVPAALAPGHEGAVVREALSVLWRTRPGHLCAVAASMAALPGAILAWAAGDTGARAVATTAVVLAWAARGAVAATWTRSTRGDGAALAVAAAAPVRDLAALGVLAASAVTSHLESGGARFAIRRGGVLVPAGEARGGVDEGQAGRRPGRA